jgi:hypothetical protein
MTFLDAAAVTDVDNSERLKVSACLRERHIQGQGPPVVIFRLDRPAASDLPVVVWEDLVANFPKTVPERLDRTLLNLAKLCPIPGSSTIVDAHFGPVTFAEKERAMTFALSTLAEQDLVTYTTSGVLLKAKGWERVGELQRERGRAGTKQAFVAMMLSGEWQSLYEGIERGVKAAGYEPLVMAKTEHNQKIDDQIIAEIRRSRFVVAEFTGHRQSVYFEAGFALGLGIPVIWACRKDQMKDAHFDTRQYNHIDWETPDDLAKRLEQRIRAVIL